MPSAQVQMTTQHSHADTPRAGEDGDVFREPSTLVKENPVVSRERKRMVERPMGRMKTSALLAVLAIVMFSACASEDPINDNGSSTVTTQLGTEQTSGVDDRTKPPSGDASTTTMLSTDSTDQNQLGPDESPTVSGDPNRDTTNDDEDSDAGSGTATIPPLQPPPPKYPNPDPEIPPPRD
jgi:hypothetical protein